MNSGRRSKLTLGVEGDSGVFSANTLWTRFGLRERVDDISDIGVRNDALRESLASRANDPRRRKVAVPVLEACVGVGVGARESAVWKEAEEPPVVGSVLVGDAGRSTGSRSRLMESALNGSWS